MAIRCSADIFLGLSYVRASFYIYFYRLQSIEPSCSSGFDSNDDYDYDGVSRGSFLNL